jgi:CRISPR/Cas system-associated exonuclease Cas4 (RecB family)
MNNYQNVMALDTIFSQDQIENLKSWKNSLQTEVALSWKVEEDKAEEQIHALLEAKKFQKEGTLTADELDLMFHLMRNFSANRALSKLLYVNNGLEEFNRTLRDLFYGEAPFPKRVDNFFKLKGIGTQTLSQFLLALDSKKYPLMTSQTKDALNLDAQQEQKAMEIAIARFQIKDPKQYLERTLDYLRDFIIFEQIKELLDLEKYTSVNNFIWFAIREEREGLEEALESYASLSLEKDLKGYLAKNPNRIERGLTLVEKEFDTKEIGRIDLLLIDKKGYDVVVELKKGRKSDVVVGQLSRYIGWVMKNRNKKVRGIIIVSEPDERLEYSILPFRGMTKIKYYRVRFEITDEYKEEKA